MVQVERGRIPGARRRIEPRAHEAVAVPDGRGEFGVVLAELLTSVANAGGRLPVTVSRA